MLTTKKKMAQFDPGTNVRVNEGEICWRIARVYWSEDRDGYVYDLNADSAHAFAVPEDRLEILEV